MCRVDILGTHIVSTWYSLENRVRHILTRHLLHSQTMDPEKQVNKSNQDGDGDNNGENLILLLLF